MRGEIRTAAVFGGVIVAAIAVMSVYLGAQEVATVSEPMDKSGFRQAPALAGIAEYINTTPEALASEMKDKVVLYDIWTYSCINCIRTLPFITAWDEKYSDQGLLIIGIHSPEFEFEKDADNVRTAVQRYGIEYPVVMDNDKDTWKAFENRYWPRKYIADHEGYIRYDHIGEGAYQKTEQVIQELLSERAASMRDTDVSGELVQIEQFQHTSSRTPELYLGYQLAFGRAQIGNPEGFRPNTVVEYEVPDSGQLHKFYMGGSWRSSPESMELVSEEGRILLTYYAKEVNIVAAGQGNIEVYLDGEPIGQNHAGSDLKGHMLSVSEADLYNLVRSQDPGVHTIELRASSPGLQIFTYTFG